MKYALAVIASAVLATHFNSLDDTLPHNIVAAISGIEVVEHGTQNHIDRLIIRTTDSQKRTLATVSEYEPSGFGVNIDRFGPHVVIDYLTAGLTLNRYILIRSGNDKGVLVESGPAEYRPKHFRGGCIIITGNPETKKDSQVKMQLFVTYVQANGSINEYRLSPYFESLVLREGRCYVRAVTPQGVTVLEIFKSR